MKQLVTKASKHKLNLLMLVLSLAIVSLGTAALAYGNHVARALEMQVSMDVESSSEEPKPEEPTAPGVPNTGSLRIGDLTIKGSDLAVITSVITLTVTIFVSVWISRKHKPSDSDSKVD
jgi:hypothetical protein